MWRLPPTARPSDLREPAACSGCFPACQSLESCCSGNPKVSPLCGTIPETEQDPGCTSGRVRETGGRDSASLSPSQRWGKGAGRASHWPLCDRWCQQTVPICERDCAGDWRGTAGACFQPAGPLIMKLQAYHLKVTENCSGTLTEGEHRPHASMKHACRSSRPFKVLKAATSCTSLSSAATTASDLSRSSDIMRTESKAEVDIWPSVSAETMSGIFLIGP